jgi:hypothetical protein
MYLCVRFILFYHMRTVHEEVAYSDRKRIRSRDFEGFTCSLLLWIRESGFECCLYIAHICKDV